jgi:hypothetical protein
MEPTQRKVVAFTQKEIRRFFSPRYGPSSIPKSTLLHHQGAVPLQKKCTIGLTLLRIYVTTGLGTWRTHGYLLYLVALLPLSLFFRFDVLVTIYLYDSL